MRTKHWHYKNPDSHSWDLTAHFFFIFLLPEFLLFKNSQALGFKYAIQFWKYICNSVFLFVFISISLPFCSCRGVSWKAIRPFGGTGEVEVSVFQSWQTLCNLMDCGPPGSSVHGILQARILEWVAILSSRGSSWPRDQTQISCICLLHCRWIFYLLSHQGIATQIYTAWAILKNILHIIIKIKM